MKPSILYFSGSGNSLAVAKDISSQLNGALFSIPSFMRKKAPKIKSDVIGLIFPVFYCEFNGIPHIVREFIEKIQNIEKKYIFAVATHSGRPGSTIERLDTYIKKFGGSLAGGFTVQMSIPVPLSIKMKRAFFNKEFDYEDPKMNDTKERERLQKEWAEKCKEISSYVRNRNKGTLETDGTIKKMLAKIIYPLTKYMFFSRYQELARSNSDDLDTLVQLADKSFIINEECNGCGTCAKVCPVKNINIEAKRPVWQHHCETCLACYHWCPNDAIEGEIVAYNKKEHHPHIKLKDMIIQ